MGRDDIIKIVMDELGTNKAATTRAVNKVFDQVITTVENGERVSVVGFGMFERRYRNARVGRNPITSETLTIDGGYVPVFKASKKFKARVKDAE